MLHIKDRWGTWSGSKSLKGARGPDSVGVELFISNLSLLRVY